MRILFCTLPFLLGLFFNYGDSTLACNSMDDFWNPSKPHCWNNKIGDLSTEAILRSWGNYVEKRNIIVGSGYNLTLIRTYTNGTNPSKTVMFLSGIMLDPKCFLSTGKNSLGYAFSKAGYDIWLMSYRGVGESRQHVSLDDNSCEFWDFSIDDITNEDIRKSISYINKITQRKITIVSYSMGTTVSAMYASQYPIEAKKKLNGIVMMGPAIYLNDTQNLAWRIHDFWPIIKTIPNIFAHCEISLNYLPPSSQNPTYPNIMFQVLFRSLFFGFDNDNIDPKTITASLRQNPSSTSVKVFGQFIDIMGKKKLVKYSKSTSIIPFLNAEQDVYDISKITVNVAMFSGPNDILCSPANSKVAYDKINPSFQCGNYLVPYDNFCHIDFVRGGNIQDVLVPNVLAKADMFSQSKCL